MMAEAEAGLIPTLVYVYHPESFAPLSIVEAADGVCRMVWVVDSSDPAAASMQRLLRRFGPVIDAAGLPVDDVAELAAAHGADGVLSLHDGDLVWTAELAAALERPFHTVATAVALTDKHVQRAALAAAGLAVPAFAVIDADADDAVIAAIGEEFPFPAVLKPRRGQASRDTLPIASPEDLSATLSELGAHDDGPAREYVLEEFVPDPSTDLGGAGFAPFVSVESVVEQGRVAHAAITARTPFRWPFRETGYCTPTAIEPALQAVILRVAGEAARALGVTQACLHVEIKLTDDGPVVIEVNGRPGGGMSEMLERASGFSILRTALRLAIGDPVGLEGPVPCSRVGYLLYVFPESDDVVVVDEVGGLDALRAVDGVDEIVLVRGPGQRIDWREGSEAHVFHLTGTTRDHDELRRLIAATTALVRIDVHDGASPVLEKG
jgi:predicted ATP-grasp superfamily ATP-dependent carboligase